MRSTHFNKLYKPSVSKGDVATNAWIVEDDFGNPVLEGEQVFVLENGATIHVDAVEDYLIEKLEAKVVHFEAWDERTQTAFMFKNGSWLRADDVEDYIIEVLGAQVFERVALKPTQK